MNFEEISHNMGFKLYRAAVLGGWIVVASGGGATFVPDTNHIWDGSSDAPYYDNSR